MASLPMFLQKFSGLDLLDLQDKRYIFTSLLKNFRVTTTTEIKQHYIFHYINQAVEKHED